MSNKLIKEYNEKAQLKIDKLITDDMLAKKFGEVFRRRVFQRKRTQLGFNKPISKYSTSQIKFIREVEEISKQELGTKLSNKHIRTYRTIIDNLFVGGLFNTDVATINFLRDKVRSPGSRDGRLLPKKVVVGMFYTFMYDPKYKKELEYYDRLPLVLVLKLHKNGFTGLNLHLIDMNSRSEILELMRMYQRGIRYRTHLKIVWEIIKKVDRFRMGRPCIRRYINDHIFTKLTRVPVDDWEIMLLIKSPRFAGQTSEKVHKDNKKKAFSS